MKALTQDQRQSFEAKKAKKKKKNLQTNWVTIREMTNNTKGVAPLLKGTSLLEHSPVLPLYVKCDVY